MVVTDSKFLAADLSNVGPPISIISIILFFVFALFKVFSNGYKFTITKSIIGNERDLWSKGFGANVVRALSLVPDALRDWKELAAAQYIPLEKMRDYYQGDARALNRLQMELVAGRVSSINECFY